MSEVAEKLDGENVSKTRRVDATQVPVIFESSIAIGLLVDVTLGKMLQPSQKKATDVLRPYLRAAHVQPGGILDADVETKKMWFSESEAETLDLCSGDTVVVEGGAGFGRSAYLQEDLPGWGFQNSIIRLRGAAHDGRYLMYALHSALESGTIHVACNAATFAHFTAEKVESFRVPHHQSEKRKRIADYLDRETGQIDAMIDKLGAVTQELLERRAGVIQRHTVSSGGRLTRLKFCAGISLGKTFQGVQKQPSERFVNYVRAASIQTHGLELDDQRMWMTDAELDKYNLLSGDVLIVEGGAGYGRSVVLSKAMPGWGFQNHVIRVRPNKNSDGRFLNYCVKAHFDAGLIDILVDGATIPALSSDKARELPVLAAPLDEQKRIADHLDEVTSKIDTMLAKVAQLKDLLTERRAALITDVVTGRKDVA